MKLGRHFLDLNALDSASLRSILTQASLLKKHAREEDANLLEGRVLALIFERPSTRTRISFQVAMVQLGRQAVALSSEDSQLGRGETMADTARVLSRYVDAIVLRATKHKTLLELAEYSEVPVINGLTNRSHPCQLMADVMTFEEHRGPIADRVVAWSGDGNNVANSWIHAAVRFGFELRLACPVSLSPDAELVKWAEVQGGRVTLTHDAKVAVEGADCVVTDTWVSMGAKATSNRQRSLVPFKVDGTLMSFAKPDALFMHCLPAERGVEVTDGVCDSPNSIIFDQAENRMHAQNAIMLKLLSDK